MLCSPGMANHGGHTAIDVQRHAGGLTIWEFLAAPTILCVRVAAEHYFVQGMVPATVVLTCEPCLAFLRTSSGSFRTGCPRSDGSSRLRVRRSEKSGEQGSHEPRSWGRSRGFGVGSSGFGPGLPIGETARRRLVPEASAPVGEVG